jgi:hypothetical protein
VFSTEQNKCNSNSHTPTPIISKTLQFSTISQQTYTARIDSNMRIALAAREETELKKKKKRAGAVWGRGVMNLWGSIPSTNSSQRVPKERALRGDPGCVSLDDRRVHEA